MGDISKQERVEMYRVMRTIRAFESRVEQLYADGELPGFVHLYIGEEAVAAGACQALRDEDYITSTHRGHGHCIAKGQDLDGMMAELYGRETGACSGKGGSMHITDPAVNNLGANGIVGAGIPIGVGAALSSNMRGTDQVAVSFVGDGALAQGAFHEGLNLAGVWNLPFVCIVENNQFGEMTPVAEQHSVERLADHGDGYNVRTVEVDGMDPDAVYRETEAAVAAARSGEGPALVVCETYRFRGHHQGDTDQYYRTDAELEAWNERDPVSTYASRLLEEHAVSRGTLDEIDSTADERVDAAVAYARESPEPDPEAAYTNVFTEET